MTFTTLILLVFYVNFQFLSFISFTYLLFIYLFIIYLVICRFNSILFFIFLEFYQCIYSLVYFFNLKFLAIPHLFGRLFLISWETDRDCLITIPLSLKTVEVQIRRMQVCLELWGHVDLFFSNYYNLQSVYFELECRCRCR